MAETAAGSHGGGSFGWRWRDPAVWGLAAASFVLGVALTLLATRATSSRAHAPSRRCDPAVEVMTSTAAAPSPR